MTATLSLISIVLATGILALGYGLRGLWLWMILIVALGLLWLVGRLRTRGWIASLVLIIFVVAAANGLWLENLGIGWMLVGLMVTLAAWDLDHFAQRLNSVERIEGAQELERRHLLRLLMVEGVSVLLVLTAWIVQIDLSFGGAFLLALFAILGLSRTIQFLRSESGPQEELLDAQPGKRVLTRRERILRTLNRFLNIPRSPPPSPGSERHRAE